jgi:hypothetical protein
MKKDKTNNTLLLGKLRDAELTILVDSIRSITSSIFISIHCTYAFEKSNIYRNWT